MQWVTKGDRKRENTRHLIPKKKTQQTGAVDNSKPRMCSRPKKGNVVGTKRQNGTKKLGYPMTQREEAEIGWETKYDKGDRPRPVDIYVSSLNKMKIIKRII